MKSSTLSTMATAHYNHLVHSAEPTVNATNVLELVSDDTSVSSKNCSSKCDPPKKVPATKTTIKKRQKNPTKAARTASEHKDESTANNHKLPTTEPQTSSLRTADSSGHSEKPPPNNFSTPCASPQNFKNGILDEVLSEKKMLLMQSPEVVRFLQAQQRKRKLSL